MASMLGWSVAGNWVMPMASSSAGRAMAPAVESHQSARRDARNRRMPGEDNTLRRRPLSRNEPRRRAVLQGRIEVQPAISGPLRPTTGRNPPMKHLLAAAAMAALLAAPVWAQTSSGQPESTAPSTSNPAGEAQSGASTPSNMTGKQHRHRGNQASMHNRGSRSSKEETAEELNRQELQQIMQGNAQ